MAELRATLGRPVISQTSGHELGTVQDLMVDPESKRIRFVRLSARGSGELLDWSDVAAFGADAVMVENDDVVHEARDDEQQRVLTGDTSILDKLILSDQGNACGQVQDVQLDLETGEVQDLRTENGALDAQRLVGIGAYAVIIKAAEGESVSGL
jgi:sporulation protein YlmC with PRC-barrel domain